LYLICIIYSVIIKLYSYTSLFRSKCFSNRGTNGIEGSLSTAVGYSAAVNSMTVLLTGDLSFFYDINGIWNRYISPNLRIMINNRSEEHTSELQSRENLVCRLLHDI